METITNKVQKNRHGQTPQQEPARGTFCHVTVQCFLNSLNFKYLFSSKLSTNNFKQLIISKHHCTLSVAVSILASRLLVTNGRTTLLSNKNNLSNYNTITIGYILSGNFTLYRWLNKANFSKLNFFGNRSRGFGSRDDNLKFKYILQDPIWVWLKSHTKQAPYK